MKRFAFIVPRCVTHSSDVAVELCGDLGSGEVAYDRPFPPGRVRLWPAAAPMAGHLLDGHLVSRHLDAVDADGHLECGHLRDGHLRPRAAVRLMSPAYVFGRFGHAVRLFDGAGNAAIAFEHEVTVNDSPMPPAGLRRTAWNAGEETLTFAFEPVRFHAAAGG